MATHSNYASGRNTDRRKTGKKKGSQKAKIIIFLIEIIIIIAMLFVVWKVFQTTEEVEGPKIVEMSTGDVVINEEVRQSLEQSSGSSESSSDSSKSQGYWNIALFGVDYQQGAKSISDVLESGSRSDSIMIASVNLDTGDIKLVSVYRDTYLNKGNDKYGKCNAAYAAGGAPQAISMLNMNLDLAITDFVTVSYQAVKECVDGLGGVWIDVDSAELEHINNYQLSIITETGMSKSEYTAVTDTGYQLLNGLQATAYCRIRYTKGDDFKRAERQREVLQAMEDQAKKADLSTLTTVVTNVLPYVYTSVQQSDILDLIKNINNYSIVDEGGFPTEELRTTATLGEAVGSCVIPLDLEQNVVWLHEFLFGDEDYQVSSSVKEYSAKVKKDSSPYLNN